MFKKKRNKNIFVIRIKLQVILDMKVVLKEDNSWSIRGVQPQYMYFLIIMYLEIARENLNVCTTFECLCFRKYWNTSKRLYGLSVKMQWKNLCEFRFTSPLCTLDAYNQLLAFFTSAVALCRSCILDGQQTQGFCLFALLWHWDYATSNMCKLGVRFY